MKDQITSNIIRLSQVKNKIGLGRSTIYAFIKAGNFPKPINLGLRSVGWLESDIDGWIQSRINNSQNNGE